MAVTRSGVTSRAMSSVDRPRGRRPSQRPGPKSGLTGPRIAALGSLVVVLVGVALIVHSSSSSSPVKVTSTPVVTHPRTTGTSTSPNGSSTTPATGKPGTASIPILVYHVINTQPAQSTANPGLYVPVDEFSSQMQALKANGWHAVTLNQVAAYWARGTSLGTGKPIVITFDSGYASHYVNALPVLKRLGWVGVENLQVTGLPPSDGGLSETQIRGLIAAGWELDTQGVSQSDLTILDTTQLTTEVTTARQTLRSRFGVPVNWFSYPSGAYNASVVAAVRAAGYVGATTTIPGWAGPQQDRFRLPRLAVAGGTTATDLLAQIESAKTNTTPPPDSSSAAPA